MKALTHSVLCFASRFLAWAQTIKLFKSMKTIAFSGVLLCISNFISAQSSTTISTPGATPGNWSAATWTGGTAPTTNNGVYNEGLTVNMNSNTGLVMDISFTLTGDITWNTTAHADLTIPAGVTVVINGNFTDTNNNLTLTVYGTLIVTGTLTANQNTTLAGTGSISGGSLNLGGGGTGCSGGCPGLSFTNCSSGGGVCSSNTTSSTYIWKGTTSDWQVSTNWTPTRTTPASSDLLYFNAIGSANSTVTNVPTQTVGKVTVSGATSYTFQTSAASSSLTLSSLSAEALEIDNGSTLAIGSVGHVVNITMPSGGIALIGGQLNLVLGTFDISSSSVILHTNSSPLIRTNGQVNVNSGTVLAFGETGLTSGNITLSNNIFNGAPTINSLVMNTISATLGNQPITITTSATFTSGVLNTNSSASLVFATTAGNPIESSSSYISGYATMNGRAVNTGSLSFLGFNMASGADNIGTVSLVRRTGSSGINSFNANVSVASSWDVTALTQPSSGRTIYFTWPTASLDNGNNATLKFQDYLNTGSGFNKLGALQNLTSQGPPRQSATASTTILTGTFTLADQNNTLPITLVNFSSTVKASSVLLAWETAAEINNDYFTILRSHSGTEFEAIGTVKGNGTTSTSHGYSLADNKPLLGKNYYQLKQTDFDGHSITSETIVVDVKSLEAMATIYPNPISQNQSLNIDINGLQANLPAEIQIVNMQGLQVSGAISNTDSEGSLKTSLALNGLSSGLYILKVQNTRIKFIIE